MHEPTDSAPFLSITMTLSASPSQLIKASPPTFASILDMAEGLGLSPDYSCRSGICHTCMCALKDGVVEYVEEPLDPPDRGSVLICCSKPKTDLVVDA